MYPFHLSMPRRRSVAATLLLVTCLFSSALTMHAETLAEDEYARGTHALDEQRWSDAITSFDRVAEAKAKKADAALYWKAYALNKLGRASLVSGTCTQLHSAYPASAWNKDCTVLTIGNASFPGTAFRSYQFSFPNRAYAEPGSDADLKMLALNSLLNREPAQALPLLRNILANDNSPALKRRAISLLAQNHSPEAQTMLQEVATGKLAPTQQREAIQMMGVFQGKRAGDTLVEIYRTSNDPEVKRAAVSALFVSGDAARMVDLARNEKDLQMKHTLVAQLALMRDKAATDYMIELLK